MKKGTQEFDHHLRRIGRLLGEAGFDSTSSEMLALIDGAHAKEQVHAGMLIGAQRPRDRWGDDLVHAHSAEDRVRAMLVLLTGADLRALDSTVLRASSRRLHDAIQRRLSAEIVANPKLLAPSTLYQLTKSNQTQDLVDALAEGNLPLPSVCDDGVSEADLVRFVQDPEVGEAVFGVLERGSITTPYYFHTAVSRFGTVPYMSAFSASWLQLLRLRSQCTSLSPSSELVAAMAERSACDLSDCWADAAQPRLDALARELALSTVKDHPQFQATLRVSASRVFVDATVLRPHLEDAYALSNQISTVATLSRLEQFIRCVRGLHASWAQDDRRIAKLLLQCALPLPAENLMPGAKNTAAGRADAECAIGILRRALDLGATIDEIAYRVAHCASAGPGWHVAANALAAQTSMASVIASECAAPRCRSNAGGAPGVARRRHLGL